MTARLTTPLSERLGLAAPIIQAPMAGGPSSPELVAACCAAGVLGSFGFAYTQPEEMKKQAGFVRARTDRPFHINLFLSPPPEPVDAVRQSAALAALAPWYAEMGLPAPEAARAPYAPDLEAQLAAVEAIAPRVFSSHLGVLEPGRIKTLKARGILVGGSATGVEEARRLEALAYDFVVAQGGEAGGHRGTWLRDPEAALTGTLALTRLVVRAVRLPVVASGGIMDGAGIAAVLALGAQAAQLGTAFIPCPESGAPEVHKRAILAAREDDTRVTDKFSGKAARGIANRFLREAEAKHLPRIAFPAQNKLTGPLRQASAKAGKPDFYALWAGQAAPLARALPAAELVAQLEREALEALRGATAYIQE
jgi:nitronate monooxygenase